MSLLDAFIEEGLYDYPVVKREFHIALRTDTVTGSGTGQDPYNGSTPALLGALLQKLSLLCNVSNPISIRFGPGTFVTGGYDPSNPDGWSVASGMRITGSGVNKTILKLLPSSPPSSSIASVVGHDLAGFLDGFEISDLTLDADNSTVRDAVSGICVTGRNILIQRISVQGLTAKASATSYGVLALRTNGAGYPFINCVVQQVLVRATNSTTFTGKVIGIALESGTSPAPAHQFCVIRNCTIDFGDPATSAILSSNLIGLSAGGGLGTIVEQNFVSNTNISGPLLGNAADTPDVIIRNNSFRNVHVAMSESFSGAMTTKIGRMIFLNNRIEWADSPTTLATGVSVVDSRATPLLGDFIIRGNVMRRVSNPATLDLAVQLQWVANAVVDDNIVDVLEGSSLAPTQGIVHTGTGHFTVFNNNTSAGSLVRGYNVTTSLHDPELTTEVENLWMAL